MEAARRRDVERCRYAVADGLMGPRRAVASDEVMEAILLRLADRCAESATDYFSHESKSPVSAGACPSPPL
jgi:hypothetical protein